MLLLGLFFFSCAAEPAWAWGPAVHIGFGSTILSQLGLLPAAVAALLTKHAIAYLYGNIAADVVFAKRLSRVKQSCHHWSTGFRLVDSARSEPARAFAYGYLSHLAADTVAHGKFVPHQILVSNSAVNFGHLYWELRADATMDAPTWRTLESVIRQNHAEHHALLAEHMRDTFLSYAMNRRLFDVMNALALRRTFRRSMDVVSRCSRWYLSPALMDGYRQECVDRIHSILTDGPDSALLQEDPNGTSALMGVYVHRRDARRLKRRGWPVQDRRREASRALAPQPRPRRSPAPPGQPVLVSA